VHLLVSEQYRQSAEINKTEICSSIGILFANIVTKDVGVM